MKKIIILSGDPNSINSEIIFKSWKKIGKSLKKRIYLISNYKLIKNQFKKLGYSIKVQQVKNIDESSKNDSLKIINIDLIYKNPFKVSLSSNQKFVIKCLNLGHKLSLNKNISGIINCPINKKLLRNLLGGGLHTVVYGEYVLHTRHLKHSQQTVKRLILCNESVIITMMSFNIPLNAFYKTFRAGC